MKKNISIALALLVSFSSTLAVKAENKSIGVKETNNIAVDLNKHQSSKSIDNLVGHYNNKIQIFFSDIDGTIMPTGKKAVKGEVPLSVMIAADNLKQAKIPMVLATGRSMWEARQIAQKIGITNSYLIAEQGSEIINPQGEIIFQDNIDTKDFKKILKAIDSYKKKNHLNSRVFFVADAKPYAKEEFDLPYIFEKRTVIKSDKELKPSFKYTKISICETNPETLKKIQTHLKKLFPTYHIDISADCYVDITSATATKGNAIAKLSKILGTDLKNTAVIGDAENDISMLKLIKENGGLAIAVGNAMDSVKNNANFVTSTVYDGGFAKAVDKVLENNDLLNKKAIGKAH